MIDELLQLCPSPVIAAIAQLKGDDILLELILALISVGSTILVVFVPEVPPSRGECHHFGVGAMLDELLEFALR